MEKLKHDFCLIAPVFTATASLEIGRAIVDQLMTQNDPCPESRLMTTPTPEEAGWLK